MDDVVTMPTNISDSQQVEKFELTDGLPPPDDLLIADKGGSEKTIGKYQWF